LSQSHSNKIIGSIRSPEAIKLNLREASPSGMILIIRVVAISTYVDRRCHKQEYGMTQEQVAVVQQSFAKVAPIADRAAAMFYDRLFEVAPQVKAMFPADMAEQRRKLMATLGVVVNGLSNLESVLSAASALAKRHVAYGAKPEHYPVVGSALLWTLERGLGDAWTREVADAWTAAYGTLSGYMIEQAYGGTQAAE
jgi:hemoglobin-like flavoprotein